MSAPQAPDRSPAALGGCHAHPAKPAGAFETRADAETPSLTADQVGFICAVSPAFCRELGWREENLLGKPLVAVVPPGMRHAHHLGFARFLQTGRPTLLGQPLTLPILRGDGREQTVELFIEAASTPEGWTFRATIVSLEGHE